MDHQSNGAAEVIVQMLRSRASLLVQQIKNKVAGGRLVFGMQGTATYYHRKTRWFSSTLRGTEPAMNTSASPSNGKVVQLVSCAATIWSLEKWLLKFSLTLIGPATVAIEGPYHAARYSWEVASCFLRAALKSWCHGHQQRLRFMHAHQEAQTRSFWQDWCGG